MNKHIEDLAYLENWVIQLEEANKRIYERTEVTTALAKTHVWGLHTQDHSLETLVIFLGATFSWSRFVEGTPAHLRKPGSLW